VQRALASSHRPAFARRLTRQTQLKLSSSLELLLMRVFSADQVRAAACQLPHARCGASLLTACSRRQTLELLEKYQLEVAWRLLRCNFLDKRISGASMRRSYGPADESCRRQ
jgi:hypothetical protein